MWYEHRVTCDSKLGIVIAAYNAEKFLAKTLESIRNITYENYVCVIVDDGSTDRTRAIAESYVQQELRFKLISIENSGPCVARNTGYKHLDHDAKYIVFTDADDVIFQDTYQRFIEILEQNNDFVAVHGLGTFIDELDQVDKTGMFERVGLARQQIVDGQVIGRGKDQPTTFESLVISSTVFPPGLVVHRKSLLEVAGLFDPACRYAEDWDLLLRVSRYGSLKFVPQPVLYYRRHTNNVGTSPNVPNACKMVWTKTYRSDQNKHFHRDVLLRSFVAKNVSERRQYIKMIVSGLTSPSPKAVTRGLKGVVGTTFRLIIGRP